ncbi:diaminopimelate decarboxylase [Paenisporosarcina cavernae]|uniref:Diaminopimelate decarboxylase n=1 Tax=Paenisporosarcina cavernae TaxID=2320858 RepID=A0A385YRI2_9BACL|nr:diaminopimelate decarboxylase [Paenisporosarcina cavernae]AYC29349.1 diaminopimelate decarboxylase [Paenisporosarcina cavernae]
MSFVGTKTVNNDGHLIIAGINTLDLAKEYGTPLFVYDVALIKERANAFMQTFKNLETPAQVAYASKAFSSIAMYQLAKELELSLDVVSLGELYTALQSGFPKEKIHFHGNNKSEQELKYAIEEKIGCIVVDNFHEINVLRRLLQEYQYSMPILLRVTPGIEAHTHDYITTGQSDSKFGFDLENGQLDQAFQLVKEEPFMNLLGIHAHIGSQIFDTAAFSLAAEKLLHKMVEWKTQDGFTCSVLNLGGGFGIRYTKEDHPLPASRYVEDMIQSVKRICEKASFPLPEIWIEPGRSLVGDAGTTLYTIGSSKEIPGKASYVAVDGGMSDNIRPALYQAKYDAIVANKGNHPANTLVTIAGKCCESGDKLIENIFLPSMEAGDILAVHCTGAYGYSMASNYNRLQKPAVVFVEDGKSKLVVKRESLEDLVRQELFLLDSEVSRG